MERVRVSPGVSPWPWCALRKQRGRKDQCSFVGYTEEQNCGLYCEVNPLIDASAHGSLWYGWRCLEFCVANKVWRKELCGDSCLLPTLSRFAELSLAPKTSLQGTISKCVGIMWHGRRSSTATSKNPTLLARHHLVAPFARNSKIWLVSPASVGKWHQRCSKTNAKQYTCMFRFSTFLIKLFLLLKYFAEKKSNINLSLLK